MSLHDRTHFDTAYSGIAPWDIDGPQKLFVDVAENITGSILDSGCGTGENALYFASRGHKVTGIDFLAEPINRAKRKATDRGLAASFFVMDALELKQLPEVFDTVIDSGLFHVFNDEDRKKYVEGLASVLKPDGKLFMICFSDAEPGTHGPRRVTRQELEATFAVGWKVETMEPSRFQIRPDFTAVAFSEGGPKAWFVVVQKAA